MSTPRTYGLMLSTGISYGTRRVDVALVSREDGKEHPLGVSDTGFDQRPKHLADLAIDGLGIYGFVSDLTDFPFIGDAVEYRNVFSIDQRRAHRMQRTLSKCNRALDKAKAYESGDKLIALAKVLKLDFVVERKTTKPAGRYYNEGDWRWMSVEEGRNRYRALIAEQREAAIAAAKPERVNEPAI